MQNHMTVSASTESQTISIPITGYSTEDQCSHDDFTTIASNSSMTKCRRKSQASTFRKLISEQKILSSSLATAYTRKDEQNNNTGKVSAIMENSDASNTCQKIIYGGNESLDTYNKK